MKLQEDEKVLLMSEPEPSLMGVWFFTKIVVSVIVVVFLTFWSIGFLGGLFAVTNASRDFIPFDIAGNYFVPVVIIALISSVFYFNALRKTYSYRITNKRCVFKGGIVRRTERSIPHHKVTDVEVSENILERLLGISKVRVFTPGTASTGFSMLSRQSSEITFEGLKDGESVAEEINRLVRENGSKDI